MDDVRLPKDVFARAERRWANKLQEQAKAWTSGRPRGEQGGRVIRDGQSNIPVVIKRGRRGLAAQS